MGGAGYQAGPALTTSCDTLDDVREAARQLMRANESNPDPNTSVIIGSSALVALYHRERTGEGQAVYVDMLNANAHANADAFLSYAGMGARPAVDAELHGTGPCHRLYRARSGWVFLEVTTDDEWSRFVRVAGVDEAARDDAAAIAAALAVRDAAEWEALLSAVGVACVRADEATPGNVYADSEQFRVNGFVPVTHHARFGEIRRWGAIVHVGGPAPSYGPGVLAGQDTDALLAELGHRADDVAALRAAGIVTSEPTAVFGA
jgi:crotonobetainyl-CoA:carnitine CoA-transferase CaiB-like acyl-CoA transferase